MDGNNSPEGSLPQQPAAPEVSSQTPTPEAPQVINAAPPVTEKKPGFFAKLFGFGGKTETPQAVNAPEMPTPTVTALPNLPPPSITPTAVPDASFSPTPTLPVTPTPDIPPTFIPPTPTPEPFGPNSTPISSTETPSTQTLTPDPTKV